MNYETIKAELKEKAMQDPLAKHYDWTCLTYQQCSRLTGFILGKPLKTKTLQNKRQQGKLISSRREHTNKTTFTVDELLTGILPKGN